VQSIVNLTIFGERMLMVVLMLISLRMILIDVGVPG
jgi:hypothetical protein